MLALLLASAALAQDPAPAPVPAPAPAAAAPVRFEHDWKLVDHRALNTFRVGEGFAIAGTGVVVAGIVLGSPGLTTLGTVGEAFGLPIMSGASLRSRRALYEQGAVIRATPGALAWTLWGAGLLVSATATSLYANGDEQTAVNLYLAAGVLRIGGYTAAGLQGGANKRARYRLSLAPR